MVIVFDLDDTLYDEVDFVKSGFKEISNYLQNDRYYEFMLNEFMLNGSGRVFNKLIDMFNLDISLQKLIEIYRFHKPNLVLPKDSLELLLYSRQFNTSLISDGHYVMQENKFNILGLKKYIQYPIFTDFYHTSKPNLKPFEMVMQNFEHEQDFIYISDNPKKDFIAPNELGWQSIRYKNLNGIYKKYKSNASYEVDSRLEIIDILKELNE